MAYIRNYPDETPRTGFAAFAVLLLIVGTVAGILVSGAGDFDQTAQARIHSTPADLELTQPGAALLDIDPAMTATIPTARPLTDEAAMASDAAACNLTACAASYRSFRASDCTYLPLDGPRRLCTK